MVLVKNGTYVAPTLIIVAVSAGQYKSDDPRLRYVTAAMRQQLLPETNVYFRSLTEEEEGGLRDHYLRTRELVSEMHRAGVAILAGTDTSLPGFSLHDELAELVESGLSPLEALQAATVLSAKFFGKLDSMGTIAKGKVADLVLLDADPLQDVNGVRRISGVVTDGRWLPRSKLDNLLTGIEAAARPM
jgi:imidazolonepropionase-like amidohydrolase